MSSFLDSTGLSYFSTKIKAWVSSQLGNYIPVSQKGNSNGLASLDNNGKLPLSQLNDAVLGNVAYQGTWNASTGKDSNSVAIPTPSTANKGNYWITSVGGTYSGTTYEVGDWIISHGDRYDKVDNTDAVSSVNGKTGVVVISKSDLSLSNVDNTSDTNKSVSTATQTALKAKQDKLISGTNIKTVGGTSLLGNGISQFHQILHIH